MAFIRAGTGLVLVKEARCVGQADGGAATWKTDVDSGVPWQSEEARSR
jgi:hypothetical protein